MTTMDAILLGLVQGLTEFLPVSSSAHLVAAERLLGVQSAGVTLEVALHAGTLAAILLVLWRDVAEVVRDGLRGALLWVKGAGREARRSQAPLFGTAVAIVVGSVPVGLAGTLAGEAVGRAFGSLTIAGVCLFGTGLILLAVRLAAPEGVRQVGPGRGLAVGLAQVLALLPGISRSGVTIVAGRLVGLDRRTAGRFSFLLAAPALAGAAVWELVKTRPQAATDAADPLMRTGALAAGVLVSALVGTCALMVLLRVIERGRLHWFAAYCLPAGALMALYGALT